jgi:hypothetical protein
MKSDFYSLKTKNIRARDTFILGMIIMTKFYARGIDIFLNMIIIIIIVKERALFERRMGMVVATIYLSMGVLPTPYMAIKMISVVVE